MLFDVFYTNYQTVQCVIILITCYAVCLIGIQGSRQVWPVNTGWLLLLGTRAHIYSGS